MAIAISTFVIAALVILLVALFFGLKITSQASS